MPEAAVKIAHLEAGRLFQFVRQRDPMIHEILDPAEGTYRTVGIFGNAFPTPLALARGPYGGVAGERDIKPISDYAAELLREQGLPTQYCEFITHRIFSDSKGMD
jgi:hypothetical protein